MWILNTPYLDDGTEAQLSPSKDEDDEDQRNPVEAVEIVSSLQGAEVEEKSERERVDADQESCAEEERAPGHLHGFLFYKN